MSVRPRSTVSPYVPSKRIRRMPSRNRGRKASITRSMSVPKLHYITRTCSVSQRITANGFVPATGVTPSNFFSLWFTNQSAFIWLNASNYSTVSVPGYSDLAALFDEVKIAAIEIQIISGNDPNVPGTSGTGATGSGIICMATDYNDKNAPTAIGDVQQYADARNIRLANNFIHREILNPKFLTYSLDSAGSPIASTPKSDYIRSNLDIEHFGKKGCILQNVPGEMYALFSFKYKFVCKTCK